MLFTTFDFASFLVVVFSLYWALRRRAHQNLLLLGASYVFYGWVHPWFCWLIATSTVVDYACGLGMESRPTWRRPLLGLSLAVNLGMLGFFKYFGFFAENVQALAAAVGLSLSPITLQVFLPVGISFYTFQTLSYTIDVYRGQLRARRNFVDFALFVAFFPQLVAGPIERARRFLPQIENVRTWSWHRFLSAWPLLAVGFFKKLVVADNIAGPTDRVFMLEDPSFFMILCGAFGFTIQVYADFSAYTDIARGAGRLIGFELVKNFDLPYLSRTLGELWRRWHVSLSSWIRDYVYLPLGGSRVTTERGHFLVLVTTMGLAGLWHGAGWNFVLWGVYHGVLLFVYRRLGLGGRWRPRTALHGFLAWAVTMFLFVYGLAIFRSPSIPWFLAAMHSPSLGLSGDDLVAGIVLCATIVMYSLPWLLLYVFERFLPRFTWLHSLWYWVLVLLTVTLAREGGNEFVYFQF